MIEYILFSHLILLMSISNLLSSNNLDLQANTLTAEKVFVTESNITATNQLATKAYVDSATSGTGDLEQVLQAGDDARGESIVGLNNLTTTGNITVGGDASISGDTTTNAIILNGFSQAHTGGWGTTLTTPEGALLIEGGDPTANWKPAMGVYSDETNGERNIYFWTGNKSGNQRTTGWENYNLYLGSTVDAKVQLNADDTTDATSATTGSIVTAGGVGIAKQLHVDGATTINGNLNINNIQTILPNRILNLNTNLPNTNEGIWITGFNQNGCLFGGGSFPVAQQEDYTHIGYNIKYDSSNQVFDPTVPNTNARNGMYISVGYTGFGVNKIPSTNTSGDLNNELFRVDVGLNDSADELVISKVKHIFETDAEVQGGLSVTGLTTQTSPSTEGIFMGVDGSSNTGIEICAGSSNQAYLDFTQPSVDYNMRILGNYTDSKMIFSADNGATNTFTIDHGNQRVGINNTSPSQALDITGNINLTGSIVVGTNFLITGDGNFSGNTVMNNLTVDGTTTLSGLDMDSNKITNLATPTDANDAVNKNYVDSLPVATPPMSSFSSSVYDQTTSGTYSIINADAEDYKIFHSFTLVATGNNLGTPNSGSYSVRISDEWIDHDFILMFMVRGNTFAGSDASTTVTFQCFTDETWTTPSNRILNASGSYVSFETFSSPNASSYTYAQYQVKKENGTIDRLTIARIK